MTKITEIIPNDIPEWASKAIAEGNFFAVAIKREAEIKQRCIDAVEKRKSKIENQNGMMAFGMDEAIKAIKEA